MDNNLQNGYSIPIKILLNHAINEYLDSDKFQALKYDTLVTLKSSKEKGQPHKNG